MVSVICMSCDVRAPYSDG